MPDLKKELSDLLDLFDSDMDKHKLALKVSDLLDIEKTSKSMIDSATQLLGDTLDESDRFKLKALQDCLLLPTSAD